MKGSFNTEEYVTNTYAYLPTDAQEAITDLLNAGALAGTGKVIILAADQWDGVHNLIKYVGHPELFDAAYIPKLAKAARVNAVALHPQQIREIPAGITGLNLLYKINMQDGMDTSLLPVVVGSVEEASVLGCSLIGYTLNHASQLPELQQICAEAHAFGLAVVVWCYTRGKHLQKDGKQVDTAYDAVITLLRQAVAAGADILKIKFPADDTCIASGSEKAMEKLSTPAERIAFFKVLAQNRLVLISGGEAKDSEEKLLAELKIVAENADGSAMGRNITLKGSIEKGAETAFTIYREVFGVEVEDEVEVENEN